MAVSLLFKDPKADISKTMRPPKFAYRNFNLFPLEYRMGPKGIWIPKQKQFLKSKSFSTSSNKFSAGRNYIACMCTMTMKSCQAASLFLWFGYVNWQLE